MPTSSHDWLQKVLGLLCGNRKYYGLSLFFLSYCAMFPFLRRYMGIFVVLLFKIFPFKPSSILMDCSDISCFDFSFRCLWVVWHLSPLSMNRLGIFFNWKSSEFILFKIFSSLRSADCTRYALVPLCRNVALLLDQGFKNQDCCFFHPLSNDTSIGEEATYFCLLSVKIGLFFMLTGEWPNLSLCCKAMIFHILNICIWIVCLLLELLVLNLYIFIILDYSQNMIIKNVWLVHAVFFLGDFCFQCY